MTAMAALTEAECAAVFVMLLGDEQAAQLLGQLGPEQLQMVGTSMCALEEVEPTQIADAIAAFTAQAEHQTLPAEDRGGQLRSILTQAVGEAKSDSIMQQVLPEEGARSLEIARWLAPKVLFGLIEGEHPQVIAVLLLLLDAEPAAEILALLAPPTQTQVIEKIARLGPVSPEALTMLDALLSNRIGSKFGAAALTMGGARDAANLINLADGAVKNTVMPEIEERDPNLAREIEAQLFTFDMLFELEALGMGRLLRDVESEILVDALKGLEEDARAPFFAAMSSRAADGVKDEIEMRGKLRKAEVEAAQREIIEIARKLADDGEISLGDDDGEFV